MRSHRIVFPLACLAAVAQLAACAGNPAIETGRRMITEGRLDDGVRHLEKALQAAPDDRELRASYFRSRELAVGALLAEARGALEGGQAANAEAIYRRVLVLDATNARAKNGLVELAAEQRHQALTREARGKLGADDAAAERLLRTVLAENPGDPRARQLLQAALERQERRESSAQALKAPFAKPITLEFRDTPLRTVFEIIARGSGINFAFDKDVKADAKVTVFVRNTSIDDVVKLILATNQLERKLLNDNSMLIYPNTAAKAKEYQELVARTFYLANAEAKQVQALVKSVVKSKDVYVDEKLNALVVKDTANAIRLAEQLIRSVDLPEPEVMLDLEVLEISRSRLLELGPRFPDQIGYGLLQPTTTTTNITTTGTQINTNLGGTLATGYVDLHNRGSLTSFVANPAAMLNLKNQDGDSNLLANPRIRVKNREKAKIHIGDKLPVFTTTSTANVGVSASVSYLDIGLKLDVAPTIHLDDEVGIKVGLEVSSVVKEVAGPANSLAYQVGTRTADTTLRLRNGETQVLAGLISDEERNSANRLPGLGDLPLVGRLFASHKDSRAKTEIVLLVTPRILRNLVLPAVAGPALASGTESAVGAAPLTVRASAPGSLSISGAAGSSSPTPAAPPAPAEPVEPPAASEPAAADRPESPAVEPRDVPPPGPAAPAAATPAGEERGADRPPAAQARP